MSELYYSEITRKTVSYIESNLTEDINLDSFTSVVGYLKYHLSRLFKKDSGKSIVEYIRLRRLALAATLLLETEESILTIGFLFRFQSQEAFSRAFKEVYSLPPGKYRQLMRAVRIIKEENNLNNQEQINGWNLSGSYTELYELTVDDKVFHTGTKSGRIKMSCFLKTEQVTKCGAWLRIDNVSGDTLQFDNMDSRSIHGTTEWNHYSIVLDVPEESASIHFGVLLVGKGKVWADGFRFEEVNEKVDSTNMLSQSNLPKQPINLDFSE